MVQPTKHAAWAALTAHQTELSVLTLDALCEKGGANINIELAGLKLDATRTHVTDETLRLLLDLARGQNVEAMRDDMYAGARLNNTEDRAVLHTALRARDDAFALNVDGQDVRASVKELHTKMQAFTDKVRSGAWRGATGKTITDVVNIGIGGSDLGPRLACGALRDFATGPAIHYVANIDAAELTDALKRLDPATTLFIVASKTFTTQETLTNAGTARAWLVSHLGEEAIAQHFVAASVATEAVKAFGINPENMFPMWDWVGGRYSVWSSVGLSVALSIGFDQFKAFLSGAALMDDHFKTAPLDKNMPVLMALIGVWYRNFWGTQAEAVLPYSERLRDLPRYLQQLNMESNGKSVTREGKAITYQTGPVIFGECGSVGQHSFHQWLHQGSGLVLSEFIGVETDAHGQAEHHKILNAHMKAQMAALQSGRQEAKAAQTNPGNKPSIALSLERLDPCHLGMVLALYEHKVFVQGVLWDLNSFDQYGVQLGKKLAEELMKA